MSVQLVRELDDYEGKAVLVRKGKHYYVVSSVNAMFSGFETLVFSADKDGEVTDWGEVAGGKRMSREEAIRDLDGDNA